jgi:hypothetical protein
MLHLVRKDDKLGQVELGGSMTRQVRQGLTVHLTFAETDPRCYYQVEQDAPLDASLPYPHLPNIGKQIEDMEIKMRSLLQVRAALFGFAPVDGMPDLLSADFGRRFTFQRRATSSMTSGRYTGVKRPDGA